jgi:hypothetical protein
MQKTAVNFYKNYSKVMAKIRPCGSHANYHSRCESREARPRGRKDGLIVD